MGDLERLVARLHCTSRGACARDAVVLYEDAARRRVAALVTALRGLQACCTLLKGTCATCVCLYVYCLGFRASCHSCQGFLQLILQKWPCCRP